MCPTMVATASRGVRTVELLVVAVEDRDFAHTQS